MNSRIVDWWINLRASYWFVPSLMAIAALIMSVVMVRVDSEFGDSWLRDYSWLYTNQPAGARALLSTVAGSMITVAGVTFSMTLLAVSHASAQIGPRLLSGFMRDRGNQFTLGTFIATFLYCLMVLRTVRSGGGDEADAAISSFVPHMAILFALALAIMSVAVLIYYIHHVPKSISVANVVARVGDELVAGIDRMYPEHIGESKTRDDIVTALPNDFDANSKIITKDCDGGYLRVLDAEGLLCSTVEDDLVVEIFQRPGDFSIPDRPLLRVWPSERATDEVVCKLRESFSWGFDRTPEQDVLLPAEQLTEVLGKAMSPGVNGQYTALLCINQFERAFAAILSRSDPSPGRADEDGKLRLIASYVTRQDFLAAVMRPLRQFVRNDWITTSHLVRMLQRLAAMPQLDAAAPLIRAELDILREEVESCSMSPAEIELILGPGK